MIRLLITIASLTAMLVLSGCAGPGVTKQDSGTLFGAAAGGLIGNQFGHGGGKVAATIGGAVIGGIVGNQIGKSMDEDDRRRAAEAEYAALERGRDGEPQRWRNPNNGHYGTFVPRRVYTYETYTCREYEQTIFIDGRPETMVGRACREPDGTWRQV